MVADLDMAFVLICIELAPKIANVVCLAQFHLISLFVFDLYWSLVLWIIGDSSLLSTLDELAVGDSSFVSVLHEVIGDSSFLDLWPVDDSFSVESEVVGDSWSLSLSGRGSEMLLSTRISGLPCSFIRAVSLYVTESWVWFSG